VVGGREAEIRSRDIFGESSASQLINNLQFPLPSTSFPSPIYHPPPPDTFSSMALARLALGYWFPDSSKRTLVTL
jgi:hypothetical protein